MSLNFIDIASYQATINLDTVFSQNPLDGVIAKATQGKGYVNTPYCDRWIQWCIKNGKPWGFYHYLKTSDPVGEAEFFLKHTKNYWGHGVPAADYEAEYVTLYGTYYLKQFLDTLYKNTGIKPLVYCNLSTIQADVNGFRTIANEGYPLWLAQWAGGSTGFQPKPWQSGSYAPFKKITIHQYTNKGRIVGYNDDLDLDIFYGTEGDWNTLAGASEAAPTPEPSGDDIQPSTRLQVLALLDQIYSLLKE